jgi:oligopeptide/dipeptide ABC transporter ATP-binding protein
MSILEITGLIVRYGSGALALTAVDGVDLAVPKGGTLGLVGESGCGKSTIARALVGLAPVIGGRILLEGADCSSQRTRNSARYRRKVQMVFQDPFSSLNPRMGISEMMDEAVSRRSDRPPSRAARRAESKRILELVGLPANAMDRYPHEFSGGQRQRIAIARAIAVGPQVLINDEVTSALDVSVQATILNLLRDLQAELGLSYLFISHDLSVIRVVSDEVAVMYLGQVVERAPTEQLFSRPIHPYTQALLNSIPTLASERRPAPLAGDLPDPRHPPAGCRFHTRCPVGPNVNRERAICIEQDPARGASDRPHRAACHFVTLGGAGETKIRRWVDAPAESGNAAELC